MPTLLLRLAGPMQSWGTSSRFDQRDTAKEPSKSGVLGLLAATLGIDRPDWVSLEPLTQLRMTVRHDRPGVLKRDYQTAGAARGDSIIRASGALSNDGVVSIRHYLADAAFLVALEGDATVLGRAEAALRNPVWPLALGRRSYVPSEPVWIEGGLTAEAALTVMKSWPRIAAARDGGNEVLISEETSEREGVMRMDQPLSSFAERRFGSRFVRSRWITLNQRQSNATA